MCGLLSGIGSAARTDSSNWIYGCDWPSAARVSTGPTERIAPLAAWRLERANTRLESLEKELAHLSPLGILERGYAIVQGDDGSIIRTADQTTVGARLGVRLHRGRLDVSVESVEKDDRNSGLPTDEGTE